MIENADGPVEIFLRRPVASCPDLSHARPYTPAHRTSPRPADDCHGNSAVGYTQPRLTWEIAMDDRDDVEFSQFTGSVPGPHQPVAAQLEEIRELLRHLIVITLDSAATCRRRR